jgi:hypothetical protein
MLRFLIRFFGRHAGFVTASAAAAVLQNPNEFTCAATSLSDGTPTPKPRLCAPHDGSQEYAVALFGIA